MNKYSYLCRMSGKSKENRIFNATLELIAKSGLSGLSMDAVAKASKVATGTVYIYFKGKEELLNKLYVHVKLHFSHAVSSRLHDDLPVKVLFRMLCMDYLEYLSTHHAELVFMQQFTKSPFMDDATRKATGKAIIPLMELIDRGKREMLLKDMDNLLIIAFLHGSLMEFSNAMKLRETETRKKDLEWIYKVCWDAISA